MNRLSRKHKLFITFAVIALVAGIGSFGTFAAFRATTTNTGNQISSGTVKIDQHSGQTTLYNLSEQTGGASVSRCVRVTYGGSLPAAVKLYSSAIGGDGTFFSLKVERGSQPSSPGAGMSCTGYTASSTLYDGNIGGFATDYNSAQPGKAGGDPWSQNDVVDYRFTVTTKDGQTAGDHETAKSVPAHTFTWEARNN